MMTDYGDECRSEVERLRARVAELEKWLETAENTTETYRLTILERRLVSLPWADLGILLQLTQGDERLREFRAPVVDWYNRNAQPEVEATR